MTNICERLRFKDRPLRKFFLKHDMKELVVPPFVYIPLCSSLDPFYTIVHSLPKECYAFNTKARCPALMMFELEGRSNEGSTYNNGLQDNDASLVTVDIATFLGNELERYAESEIIQERCEIIQSFTGATNDDGDDFDNHTTPRGSATAAGSSGNANGTGSIGGAGLSMLSSSSGDAFQSPPTERKPSKFSGFLGGNDNWSVEGTGMKRLTDAGISLNLTVGKPMPTTSSFYQPVTHKRTLDHHTPNVAAIEGGKKNSGTDLTDLASPALSASEKSNKFDIRNHSITSGGPSPPVSGITSPTSTPMPANSGTQSGPLGETFEDKARRIRHGSSYGYLSTWKLGGLIAKSNDDVRQEVFVMQMIQFYQKIFRDANLPVWLYTYRIMSTSKTTGLIELIPNSISFDGLKKKVDYPGSLRSWYERAFDYNNENKEKFNSAMEAYVSSMAAYSVVTYLLAIKDR
jgi:hypothetical protein